MKRIMFLLGVALVVGGSPAMGAEAPEPVGPDESGKVAEIQAQLMAGKVEEAVTAAQAYLKTARDEGSKTEAMRVLAEGLRKQGDWRRAGGAYSALADRFEKGSDDAVRYGAIGDVLKTSPKGVYKGCKPEGPDGKPRTLADEEVLNEALAKLAEYRCVKLKSCCGQLRRARSPQDLVKAFAPAAEEVRQIFLLGPELDPAPAREMGKVGGDRLQALSTKIQGALRAKLQDYHKRQKFENPWSFTNVEKKDVINTHKMCKEMGEAEKQFQECLFFVCGNSEWADADTLRAESSERRVGYEQLAEEYIVPAYRTIWGW